MVEVLIGTGGWAYLKAPSDRLMAYTRLFNYVEVNSTFYSYPSLAAVRSWRSRVPSGFCFSVKCHQELTHRFQLQPTPEAFDAFGKMTQVCRVLRADVLLLQTPSWLETTASRIDGFRRFLKSVDAGKVRLAWEARHPPGERLNPQLVELMDDLGITRCVDISKEEPPNGSDILYTRLFGNAPQNVYRFNDSELRRISEKVDRAAKPTSYLTAHSVQMYKDAARLKTFREKGSFPKLQEI